MYALLTQNTLVKLTRNYDHRPHFHCSVGAIALKS